MCSQICSDCLNLNVLGTFDDPVELWDTFKKDTLEAEKKCTGEHSKSRGAFAKREALASNQEGRTSRLVRNRNL